MKVWCLFEQSGTFKNEFKKLGFEAYDVDILDDFGETDYKIDIFTERGESCSHKGWDDLRKLQNSREIVGQLQYNYTHFCWLFEIALKKGFKMIVKNPYSRLNFLRDYFPIKPAVIIENRAEFGDLYRKPTQFWFVNCKPKNELVLRSEAKPKLSINKVRGEGKINRKTRRSMITSEFASRFIRGFVL